MSQVVGVECPILAHIDEANFRPGILGRQHPRTLNDYEPVGRGRVLVSLLGLAVFVVCFIPSPIAGSWDALLEGLGILPPS